MIFAKYRNTQITPFKFLSCTQITIFKRFIIFFMKSHHNHHRRNSSVTSLSASAAKNPEKIERIQAFDKWRTEQTDLCMDLVISEVYVHLSHRKRGNFVFECMGPTGHWLIEKSLKEFCNFQRKIDLVFPVEAGATGKPRIIPIPIFTKCPKWLLTKKEVHCWYRERIERFMRLLLECSRLIAKSRLIEDFLGKEGGMTAAEEEEEEMWSGKKVRISAPMSEKSVLRCTLGQRTFEQTKNQSMQILTVVFQSEVYPLVNIKNISDLEQAFSFLPGRKQFYINAEERILLVENFRFGELGNNQLLYMEILHE